jgi:DNA topoisomerase-1
MKKFPGGLISYMRTEATHVSHDAQKKTADFITDTYGAEFVSKETVPGQETTSERLGHEAIRPTDVNFTPEDLWKMYEECQRR